MLVDEERQHGVQILLKVAAIDPKESGSEARRRSVPMVIHTLERPLSGAACNTTSCAHVFFSRIFCVETWSRFFRIIQRGAMGGSGGDILPAATLPMACGFWRGTSRQVCGLGTFANVGQTRDQSWARPFVMPKYLPSSWMAGTRVVMGISFATAVKALCRLQAF